VKGVRNGASQAPGRRSGVVEDEVHTGPLLRDCIVAVVLVSDVSPKARSLIASMFAAVYRRKVVWSPAPDDRNWIARLPASCRSDAGSTKSAKCTRSVRLPSSAIELWKRSKWIGIMVVETCYSSMNLLKPRYVFIIWGVIGSPCLLTYLTICYPVFEEG